MRARDERVYQAPPNLEVEGVKPNRGIFVREEVWADALGAGWARMQVRRDFCLYHLVDGRDMPRRCLEDVLAEIEELRGKYVFFADAEFVHQDHSFRALIPYKISLVVSGEFGHCAEPAAFGSDGAQRLHRRVDRF